MGSLRDIPFIDTIMPQILALCAWFGLNLVAIGPHIIIPRMSYNIWHASCKIGVSNTKAEFAQKRQSEISKFIAAERARQKQAMNMINPFMQMLGQDFARTIGKGVNDTVNAVSELELQRALKDRFGGQANSLPIRNDYCGCIIQEAVSNKIETALYSASLRLWKPDSIQRLDQLDKRLIASPQCGNPSNME
ncbi:MAG: hypothetical protein OIF58_05150 [Cohaesibacter sp.]|nr:hypothetical protein [Cohaesibacter sp.]